MAQTRPILLLTQQADCYRRLAKLAVCQHEHVQQSRMEGLLEVLGQRQMVLDQLSGLEAELRPKLREWGQFLSSLPEDERRQAEVLMGETRRLLEQITSADRDDALVLQQRKLSVGRQIGQAAASRQVNRSYAGAAYGGARRSAMDIQR